MRYLEINGERISTKEAASLVKMICNDAKEIAGVFHGENRSEKFRANWPDEIAFAETNWKTFVDAARQMYAQRLGDPHTPPAEARKMHLALVLQHMMMQNSERDNRLQLHPNTQQFVGDPFENRKIKEKFGTNQNLRALLLNTAAKL